MIRDILQTTLHLLGTACHAIADTLEPRHLPGPEPVHVAGPPEPEPDGRVRVVDGVRWTMHPEEQGLWVSGSGSVWETEDGAWATEWSCFDYDTFDEAARYVMSPKLKP